MSGDQDSVTCGDHGKRPAAFVCQHLVAGSELGFHWSSSDPDARCPDAWCDACDIAFQEEGEWNQRSMAHADVELVCDRCYEHMRARNWRRDSHDFDQLLNRALPFLQEQQSRLQDEFRMDSYERYDCHQESGQLIFSNGGKPQLIADVVFVGSISTLTDTWLWSWANNSVIESVKAKMREVRCYGEEHRLLKLVGAHWSATQEDGWEMTAVATLLLRAVGAYRAPRTGGFTFMVMTDVHWAQ